MCQVVVLPYQAGQGVGMMPPMIPRPAVLAQTAPIARASADANLQPLGFLPKALASDE